MTPAGAALFVLLLLVVFAVIVIVRTVKIVPQQVSLIIERLGKFSRTLEGGLHFLIPFVDKVRANVDLREQVVSFPPQPVITSDNLVVNIDTVIYYSVIDSKSATFKQCEAARKLIDSGKRLMVSKTVTLVPRFRQLRL